MINSCCHARVQDQQDKHNSSKEEVDRREGAPVVTCRCEGEAGGEEKPGKKLIHLFFSPSFLNLRLAAMSTVEVEGRDRETVSWLVPL